MHGVRPVRYRRVLMRQSASFATGLNAASIRFPPLTRCPSSRSQKHREPRFEPEAEEQVQRVVVAHAVVPELVRVFHPVAAIKKMLMRRNNCTAPNTTVRRGRTSTLNLNRRGHGQPVEVNGRVPTTAKGLGFHGLMTRCQRRRTPLALGLRGNSMRRAAAARETAWKL